jgi:ADP-heptose:LPS heptosyltransferase
VNLSAAEPWRAWTAERCVDVLRVLLARYPSLTAVFTPLPGREAEGDAVAVACGPRVIVAPASPRFADVIALLRRARIVLTPDTSLIHVASATGRPVLGLYAGRAHNHLWQPLGIPYRAVLSHGQDPVTAIPTEAIVRAFDELMAET